MAARALMLVASLVVMLAVWSCGGGNLSKQTTNTANASNANSPQANSNAGSAVERGDTSSEDFEGTAGIVEKKKPGARVSVLRDVRTARHENFDRVVFEFEEGMLPGYHVEYVDRPVRNCGPGEVVPLVGDAYLLVRFEPSAAHTDEGRATIKDRERRPDLPVLKEMKLICDFEADVTWAMGLSSANRYRVLELSSPPRLVVDIKH